VASLGKPCRAIDLQTWGVGAKNRGWGTVFVLQRRLLPFSRNGFIARGMGQALGHMGNMGNMGARLGARAERAGHRGKQGHFEPCGLHPSGYHERERTSARHARLRLMYDADSTCVPSILPIPFPLTC
jgi:hypothetical protein